MHLVGSPNVLRALRRCNVAGLNGAVSGPVTMARATSPTPRPLRHLTHIMEHRWNGLGRRGNG